MLIVSPKTYHPHFPNSDDARCADPIIVGDVGNARVAELPWAERFWNPISLVYQTDEQLWASLGNWDL